MADGMTVASVPGEVAAVVDVLGRALDARGVRLFARIDHAYGARAAGLELDDEVLLLFGSPAVGTALMQADPRAGYDLPLRMLVWSQDGTTYVGYRDPATLVHTYALTDQQATVGKLRALLQQLVAEAGGGPAGRADGGPPPPVRRGGRR
jgi:uncharacterized protein (DUF302 family)